MTPDPVLAAALRDVLHEFWEARIGEVGEPGVPCETCEADAEQIIERLGLAAIARSARPEGLGHEPMAPSYLHDGRWQCTCGMYYDHEALHSKDTGSPSEEES